MNNPEDEYGLPPVTPVVDEVHTLIYGLPPCDFSIEAAEYWPAGHRWVEVWNVAEMNCKDCKEEAERQMKKPLCKGDPS